jgi:membrane-associated protease RseP (regulator of RpoE activity)
MLKGYKLHILLFLITYITCTLSGFEWITGKSIIGQFKEIKVVDILEGWKYAVPFLLILTFHEFGHFFVAKLRKINVTLPYYLPGWFGITMTIGTFGAFIRIKDVIKSKKDYFDIAIAGPLAGFVVAIICLIIGFSQLKSDDYIYKIHPEYKLLGADYRVELNKTSENPNAIVLGESIIFKSLKKTFANPKYIPHPYETTHYPLIFAGFLGLLFTAINLLPIGQLDGGHIMFSMIGKKNFDIVSPVFLVIISAYGGLGLFKANDIINITQENSTSYIIYFGLYIYFTYLTFSKIFQDRLNGLILALSVILAQLLVSYFFPDVLGYSGILAFAFLIGRVLGVYHPGVENDHKLDPIRFGLGILAMVIFVCCISLHPIS